jgi:hypothetical protein
VAEKTWYTEKTHTLDRVVTVGKKLSDGTLADKNYIWFSQWQLDNINAGNLIPIELTIYNQLTNNISKNLVPHLQEWLYASQRDGRFEKQYEDICQLLGVRVYQYHSDIIRKLGPSLDELVSHGYVSKWAIEPMANRKTYKLVLWHGTKYHTDQQTRIDRKRRTKTIASAAGETPPPREHRPRQQPLQLVPEVDAQQLEALTSRGVSEPAARKILAALPADFPTLDTLEWGDHQIAGQRDKFTNPPGFYISLLRDRLTPPTTFETSQVRASRQAAILAKQEALQIEAQAEQSAHDAAEAELDRFKNTNLEQYQVLYNQAQSQLFAEHPKIADFARTHPGSSMHEGAIRSRIRQLIAEGLHLNPTVSTPEPEVVLEPSETTQQTTTPATGQDDRVQEITASQILFAGLLQACLLTLQLKAPSEHAPAPTSLETPPEF